ncbi:MAG: hypothetical protein K8T91_06910 [Planctomycetes bacterium]|nr:hypothetical protein [Planctomycetota bacterium]
MKMLLLAFVAMVGIGFAAAPSMADHGHSYRGGYNRFDSCGNDYRVHRPVPIARRHTPYWPGYRPPVVYSAPGIYYSGRNVSFGIGF